MKATGIILIGLAALMASCSTGKESKTDDNAAAEKASLAGQYTLANISLGDTLSITPVATDEGTPQTVTFTDSTYHFATNCNMIQGDYTLAGDKISFGMGMSTRMACPDMSAEDALSQILPQLSRVTSPNDTTVVITTADNSSSITLTK